MPCSRAHHVGAGALHWTKHTNAMEDHTDLRTRRGGQAPLIIPGALTAGALATTAHFWQRNEKRQVEMDQGLLRNERLLGEKLVLEKRVADASSGPGSEREERQEAEQRARDLERRLLAAEERHRTLSARAQRADRSERKARELEAALGRLHADLGASRQEADDLRLTLAGLRNERDALDARLASQTSGALMLNNTTVEAVRGTERRLTVKARRTQQIRMAFDLPAGLADAANVRITAPDGKAYGSADPVYSLERSNSSGDALASIDLTGGAYPEEGKARVHLRFDPTHKLKPGTYRIDVRSAETYLNTVMLNLR